MALDLKLVLLGHKNVGKTSVFNRYVYDEWGNTAMTIGAYFGMKQTRVSERQVNLAIWDTAGEEKFDSLTNFYCRGARAALICYDITAADTFKGLARWVEKINLEAEQNCAILIVGNKYDQVEEDPSRRKVDFAEAQRYAESIGATVLEASAKSAYNIDKIFQTVVQTALQRQDTSQNGKGKGGVALKSSNSDEGGCCS